MATIIYGTLHVKSTQGILKIIELLICFIGLLLVVIDGWSEPLQDAYIAGAVIGMIIAATLLILHISKVAESLQGILGFQIYFNVAWFLYFIVTSAVLLSRNYSDKYTAAGIFGLFLSVLYIADAIDCGRIDPTPICCYCNKIFVYATAVILIVREGNQYTEIIAGGVFGIIAVLTYCVDAIVNYRQ